MMSFQISYYCDKMSEPIIRLLEMHRTGEMENRSLSRDEFLSLLGDCNLPFRWEPEYNVSDKHSSFHRFQLFSDPNQQFSRLNQLLNQLSFRDLRMILKSATSAARSRHPLIMPRPSSKCFIFEMETVKIICFSEKCFILNPEDKNTQAFIRSLKAQFRLSATNFIRWLKVRSP